MTSQAPLTVSRTVHASPRRIRVVCWAAAVAVVTVSAVVATGLHGSTGNGPGYFQRGDQAAMIGLGIALALGILAFTRPRVEADATGVRVRNVIGSYDLPWNVVRAVTFGRGAPWVTLELHDDDVVAVMAIQAVDKEYAVRSAKGLRALLAADVDLRAARSSDSAG